MIGLKKCKTKLYFIVMTKIDEEDGIKNDGYYEMKI